ncbi:hypothetical protein UFOVP736_65 [uncultured Caudovirales phage]|uniref:Uncharacterized protein n=1 Tax=uncultured Caudovirales phage TaxID=2100421 RepID=A0A6J7X1H2_9CAUD|nr:hypothetical protein UFOVP705_16 [uncultured Caudovirales phage]CAB5224380.1 hypothetical protein UFOVP736_65 [uncultured Caudovirales phage]
MKSNTDQPQSAATPSAIWESFVASELEKIRQTGQLPDYVMIGKKQPLRVSYSRAELADKLKDWMIDLWGNSPKNLPPEDRDQWHRDNGLIYHFICDHFPTENAKLSHEEGGKEQL